MTVITTAIKISTKGMDDVIDVTSEVQDAVAGSKLTSGIATIFISGYTASVTTMEYEPGLVRDIKGLGERIAPSDQEYGHNETWGDGNGFSHVRATVIGPSLTVPFDKGKLMLGTWQQIVVIDHDNRSRQRNVVIQLIGEIKGGH